MRTGGERTDWQRRYDESLAAEREKAGASGARTGEDVAMEASGWLPGALGLVVFAATAIVMLIRRRIRRP